MKKLNTVLITSVLFLGTSNVQAEDYFLNADDTSDEAQVSSWIDYTFMGDPHFKSKARKKKREKKKQKALEKRALTVYNSRHGIKNKPEVSTKKK